MSEVTKAVVAAAGYGTRFLPWTKAVPKEMLPLVDKPIIQYVIEDLAAAGIKDVIIIGNDSKRAIEDHFSPTRADLKENLGGNPKKKALLDSIEKLRDTIRPPIFMRQDGRYGNATPLMNAAHIIGDEPFIYTFADDFFDTADGPGRTAQMITTHDTYGGSVLACKTVESDDEYDRYGIVAGTNLGDGVLRARRIVEKPGVEDAPSDLASVSGYLLTPDIFPYLEREAGNVSVGEFMIQPAMQAMMNDGKPYFARQIEGTYHDTGNVVEYLKTVIHFGVQDGTFGDELRAYIAEELQRPRQVV